MESPRKAAAAYTSTGWCSLGSPFAFEFLQASLDKRGAQTMPSFGEEGLKAGDWSRCMSRPPDHDTPASHPREEQTE
jgi:hypothetical protein